MYNIMSSELIQIVGNGVSLALSGGLVFWVYKVLTRSSDDMKEEIKELKKEVKELRGVSCYNLGCKKRNPPIFKDE